MSGATILIVIVVAILGILSGWLVPIIFRSQRRPYGLWGDILVCTLVAVVLAFIEWVWILPALGFETGWIKIVAAIGDPLGLGWISLWVLRKIKS